MYVFPSQLSVNDAFQQGVDEGRRQVLADLAKMRKDDESAEEFVNEVSDYLEQEGYL